MPGRIHELPGLFESKPSFSRNTGMKSSGSYGMKANMEASNKGGRLLFQEITIAWIRNVSEPILRSNRPSAVSTTSTKEAIRAEEPSC